MSVADRFKLATLASLPIQPTAAYLLAGPTVPETAREVAIERAEGGEQITPSVAKEIVAELRKKKRPKRQRVLPTDKLSGQLLKSLELWRNR
jgi:hypothetical protein